MAEEVPPAIASELVEHDGICTLREVCISCDVNPDWVVALVEQGAIEAVGGTRHDWRFTTLSVLRVAKAKRLERDLGLNLPGIALALDLLDRLDAVRAQLQSLQARPARPADR